jgi:hypothetical protein
MCSKRRRRPNVLLVLVSPGGDAHAAYRVARCLQRNYKHVSIFVPGWCKSAATLLAVGANELIIGDCGELGPIDVQRPKEDELWESSSGLTEDAAISSLESSATGIFDHFVLEMKRISRGQIAFSLAAEIAGSLTVGLLEPIFAQIDPLKIGENSRAINIARDYGLRLGVYSQNLKDMESIDKLVSSYSSHGFCIDREEAQELFKNVVTPENHNECLPKLCELLEDLAYNARDDAQPLMRFLNTELEPEANVNTKDVEEPSNAQTDVGQPENKGGVDADARTDIRSANEATAADPRENIASIAEAPKFRRGAAGQET